MALAHTTSRLADWLALWLTLSRHERVTTLQRLVNANRTSLSLTPAVRDGSVLLSSPSLSRVLTASHRVWRSNKRSSIHCYSS